MDKDSRIKLIESATVLFATKGFAGVSIRDLADAAEVNSALISYYFGGKEGLYKAVLETQFSPILALVKEFQNLQLAPVERITYYARGVCMVHRKSPYFIRLMHSELTNPTACFESIIKKHISLIYAGIREAFLQGVASGHFSAELDANYATIALAGIMNFYFISKPVSKTFLPPEVDHDEKYVMQAVNVYLNGVRRINYE